MKIEHIISVFSTLNAANASIEFGCMVRVLFDIFKTTQLTI